MSQEFDVCLVSVFGRGNWLASALTNLGFRVALVDGSEYLGRWAPEDWEGPFGYMESDQLLASQKARLNEEDYSEFVDQGFTVLLKSGPLDLKSPLSPYLLEKRGIKEGLEKYLRSHASLSQDEREKALKELSRESFAQVWLGHLAHQLASNVYRSNSESMGSGKPLPLFSKQKIRRVSRRGREKSLEWIQDKGVKVFKSTKIKDIHVENKDCVGLELEGEVSTVVKAKTFVWMLSSEETQFTTSKASSVLYPKGVLKSSWTWMRFRLRFKEKSYTESFPLKFLIINDLFLPWTHTNMCLVQKTVRPEDMDVWVRVPTAHRFEKAYIEKISKEIMKLLEERLPQSHPQIMDMPQDYLYPQSELGPPRFPVFEEEELSHFKAQSLKNMYFDSPEKWGRMDWTGQFQHQKNIYRLLKTKKEKNEVRQGARK